MKVPTLFTLLPALLAGSALAKAPTGPEARRSAFASAHQARQEGGPPPGESTINLARPKLGSVPYGSIIERCTQPGVVALTFDDGPGYPTEQLLDLLARYNAKATFFIMANQYGPIYTAPWSATVQRTHAAGHQIASHTWRHSDLSLVSADVRQNEIIWAEMAFRDTLGFIPTYMRPPYGSCDGACQSFVGGLGYHIINWDVDTLDWQYVDDIQQSRNIVDRDMTNSGNGHIVLMHDIHATTVSSLVEYTLQQAAARGLRTVTVGECLGDPAANWYRTVAGSGGGGTTPPPTTTPSTDGTCGSTNGYTCAGSGFGDCCSQWGYCGADADYCGTGCNPLFGNCGTTTTPPTTPALPASTDGSCGAGVATCVGYAYGNCCSQYGYCGNGGDWCGAGCQPLFGTCN